jgi:type VI secretion system protein ImpH
MAGTDRTAPSALERALGQGAARLDFFQAMRLLECAHPAAPRLGKARRAADEPVRLGQEPHVSFPTGSIFGLRAAEGGRPARLRVLLFGLFGPSGPLPLHLTVHALERERQHHDPTFRAFCDLFHHRLIALFYRAWADARPPVQADRPERDRFRLYLGALCGLGLPSLRDRDALADQAKLRHAGLLGQQSRHPEVLAALIRNVMGLKARIEEFVGGWLTIPPHLRCRLAASKETGRLGRNAVVGAAVRDAQHRFRIVLGPLGLADYRRLLPGEGSGLGRLQAIVLNVVGRELAFDLRLVLRRDDVPALRLDGAARLGWTTWLPVPQRLADPGDLVLDPAAFPGARPQTEGV